MVESLVEIVFWGMVERAQRERWPNWCLNRQSWPLFDGENIIFRGVYISIVANLEDDFADISHSNINTSSFFLYGKWRVLKMYQFFSYDFIEQIKCLFNYIYKVYAEHLLEPLLKTMLALSGPKTTILVNPVFETHYYFTTATCFFQNYFGTFLFLLFIFLFMYSCRLGTRFVLPMSMSKCLTYGSKPLRWKLFPNWR